jgi:hydrogenase-4 component B
VLIVLIGLFPDIVMNALIIPATRTFNYDPVFVDTYLEGMVFFNRQDLWNVLVVYLLGGLLFITGVRFGLFHLHLPRWLHLEHSIYGPIMRYTRRITRRVYNAYAYRINASDAYIYTVIVILALLTAVGAEFL